MRFEINTKMDNSKTMIDDSSASMYFSFNSTATCKILEIYNDNSVLVDGEDFNPNDTLEALDEKEKTLEQIQTINELNIGVSTSKNPSKNALWPYNFNSSTPTKGQILQSVNIDRCSSPATINVCDLGISILEATQESMKKATSDNKENQPLDHQKLTDSETSSKIVVSINEKAQDREMQIKKVKFSNLLHLKSSAKSNISKGTPRLKTSSTIQETFRVTNKAPKLRKLSLCKTKEAINNDVYKSSAIQNSDKVTKLMSSVSRTTRKSSPKRKLVANQENPFYLLGKATRMSIVKTTLNSPARKVSRKTLVPTQIRKIKNIRHSLVPSKTTYLSSISENQNDNALLVRKSISYPRKSILHTNLKEHLTTSNPTSRVGPHIFTSTSFKNTLKNKSTLLKTNYFKENFICGICSRKFPLMSLFEAHKRIHETVVSTSALSTKLTSSTKNENKCRYCDKKFAIQKALSNHLVENCSKIPADHKKKLLFPSQPKVETPVKTKMPANNKINSNSIYDSSSKKSIHIPGKKKKSPHSGVYCTPNKQITCHVCKMHFTNILAYTEHKLSHSNFSNIKDHVPLTHTEFDDANQSSSKTYK